MKVTRYNSSLSADTDKQMRRTPIAKANAKRRKRNRERQYGAHADWIRTLPCAVPHCSHPFQLRDAAHVKSRGAGGASKDLAPLCRLHHVEQHTDGILTFQERYSLNLEGLAAELWEQSPTRKRRIHD